MAQTRSSWDLYFMEMARLVASRSEDPSTKVGCVIVGPDREVRSTGYNGMPRGVKATPERLERPLKYRLISHAETAAVGNAARAGVSMRGCAAYVTHMPCNNCAKLLIQAGITSVCVGTGTTSMPPEELEAAEMMFCEAGVRVEVIDAQAA